MSKLSQAELDRLHAHLITEADQEKLGVDYDGSITVEVDAKDVEDLVDADPELAWEIYEAYWHNQDGEYVYDDKYFGRYTETRDGDFTHEPFSD